MLIVVLFLINNNDNFLFEGEIRSLDSADNVNILKAY